MVLTAIEYIGLAKRFEVYVSPEATVLKKSV